MNRLSGVQKLAICIFAHRLRLLFVQRNFGRVRQNINQVNGCSSGTPITHSELFTHGSTRFATSVCCRPTLGGSCRRCNAFGGGPGEGGLGLSWSSSLGLAIVTNNSG